MPLPPLRISLRGPILFLALLLGSSSFPAQSQYKPIVKSGKDVPFAIKTELQRSSWFTHLSALEQNSVVEYLADIERLIAVKSPSLNAHWLEEWKMADWEARAQLAYEALYGPSELNPFVLQQQRGQRELQLKVDKTLRSIHRSVAALEGDPATVRAPLPDPNTLVIPLRMRLDPHPNDPLRRRPLRFVLPNDSALKSLDGNFIEDTIALLSQHPLTQEQAKILASMPPNWFRLTDSIDALPTRGIRLNMVGGAGALTNPVDSHRIHLNPLFIQKAVREFAAANPSDRIPPRLRQWLFAKIASSFMAHEATHVRDYSRFPISVIEDEWICRLIGFYYLIDQFEKDPYLFSYPEDFLLIYGTYGQLGALMNYEVDEYLNSLRDPKSLPLEKQFPQPNSPLFLDLFGISSRDQLKAYTSPSIMQAHPDVELKRIEKILSETHYFLEHYSRYFMVHSLYNSFLATVARYSPSSSLQLSALRWQVQSGVMPSRIELQERHSYFKKERAFWSDPKKVAEAREWYRIQLDSLKPLWPQYQKKTKSLFERMARMNEQARRAKSSKTPSK